DSELLTATDSTQTAFPRDTANVDSVYMTADTLYSRMIMLRDYQALDLKLNRDGGEIEVYDDVDYGDEEDYGSDDADLDTEETPVATADSIKDRSDAISIDTLIGIADIKLDSIATDSVHTPPLETTSEQDPIVSPTPAKKVSPLASPKKTAAINEPARTD